MLEEVVLSKLGYYSALCLVRVSGRAKDALPHWQPLVDEIRKYLTEKMGGLTAHQIMVGL